MKTAIQNTRSALVRCRYVPKHQVVPSNGFFLSLLGTIVRPSEGWLLLFRGYCFAISWVGLYAIVPPWLVLRAVADSGRRNDHQARKPQQKCRVGRTKRGYRGGVARANYSRNALNHVPPLRGAGFARPHNRQRSLLGVVGRLVKFTVSSCGWQTSMTIAPSCGK